MAKIMLKYNIGEIPKGEYNYVEDGDNYIILVPDGDGHRAYYIPKTHPDVSKSSAALIALEHLNTTEEDDV